MGENNKKKRKVVKPMSLIHDLLGKKIEIIYINGQRRTGHLAGYDKHYNLTLVQDGTLIFVRGSAIKDVIPVDD